VILTALVFGGVVDGVGGLDGVMIGVEELDGLYPSSPTSLKGSLAKMETHLNEDEGRN